MTTAALLLFNAGKIRRKTAAACIMIDLAATLSITFAIIVSLAI